MFDGVSIWFLYIEVIILVYLIVLLSSGEYLRNKQSVAIFLSALVGYAVILLVPKQVSDFSDTTSFTILAGVSSFLLLVSVVFLIIGY